MMLTRALRNRQFALLWTGQTLSSIGDYLSLIVVTWWVLEETGSAAALSAMAIANITPMILFVLVGGVVVDRFPRVPLMLGSHLGSGAIMAVVVALAYTQQLEVWHLYISSILLGVVSAFFEPAYAALVPQIVAEEDLPSANALTSIGIQVGRIAGPALGALIIAVGGTPLAFAVDSASFLVSAVLLLPLLGVRSQGVVTEEISLWRDFREGIGTVAASPWLWITISLTALTQLSLTGPFNVAIPFLIEDHFHADVRALGLLYAVFPVGYILGGLVMGRLSRIRRRGPFAYLAMIAAGAGMLALGLPIGIGGAVVAALINGAALEIFRLIWTNTVQEMVPNELLGRVSSIDMLGLTGLMPVGMILAGWATSELGAATACILGGGMTVIVAILGLLHPAIRRLD